MARAVRLYLRQFRERADIDKPITPHKLRQTYATRSSSGMRIKPVDSAEAGVLEIKRIGKRRRQHGYDAVPQST